MWLLLMKRAGAVFSVRVPKLFRFLHFPSVVHDKINIVRPSPAEEGRTIDYEYTGVCSVIE